MRRRRHLVLAGACGFITVTLLLLGVLPLPSGAAAPRTVTAQLSTYDWWNNSPPGYGISYPRVHGWACCRAGGTWADPITFASQPGELAPGTRIYIPEFRRYFIKEDDCSTCWRPPRWQFDLWVGGVGAEQNAGTSPHDIVNLWGPAEVIINPPPGLPVARGLFRQVRI